MPYSSRIAPEFRPADMSASAHFGKSSIATIQCDRRHASVADVCVIIARASTINMAVSSFSWTRWINRTWSRRNKHLISPNTRNWLTPINNSEPSSMTQSTTDWTQSYITTWLCAIIPYKALDVRHLVDSKAKKELYAPDWFMYTAADLLILYPIPDFLICHMRASPLPNSFPSQRSLK